jgi:hypothetical protein
LPAAADGTAVKTKRYTAGVARVSKQLGVAC